ncbi:unnamed protein product, partial [Lymnaea stagnalis]
NFINIIVYLKLGLNDSISICFFVLSCTDFVCILLMIFSSTATSLALYFVDVWKTDGSYLAFLTISFYGPFYDISQGITTFIAVQKCWCVALPFRFKNTFTRTRTAVILSGITLALFSMHLPILTTQGLEETLDPFKNRTLFKLWIPEISRKMYSAVGMVSLLFTNTCQFTVIFCLVVLASRLRASSKFRRATKIASTDQMSSELTAQKTKFPDQHLNTNFSFLSDEMSSNKQSKDVYRTITEKTRSGMNTTSNEAITPVPFHVKANSSKEIMAIKSTTFVSILFVFFNTFKLLNYYALICISDYSIFGRYRNTYWVTNEMRLTLEVLHCSCNMFVYLKFNTRYRSTLLACWSRNC